MVGDCVKQVKVMLDGDIMTIGDSPRLVVDLKHQNNYIEMYGRRIPYKREVIFSKDLLSGKRKNVYETAVKHYYAQACQIAEGVRIAETYRPIVNTTRRELK